MLHSFRRIIRDNVLLALVLLGSAFLGGTIPTAAQVTAPDVGIITGTAYRLVDQTIVDGVVVDQTLEPISDGRIAIPELGIDMPLSPDGTFTLSNLLANATPHTVAQVTVVFTAPGLGSFTFLHLLVYPGPAGPNLTPQLTDIPRVNDLNRAHFHDDSMRGFPATGGGFPAADSGLPAAPVLLALAGAALILAGATARHIRRAN